MMPVFSRGRVRGQRSSIHALLISTSALVAVALAPHSGAAQTVAQNGQTTNSQVGQIQTVRFANPGGLRALGRNLMTETETSGTPQLGTPGQDGFGELTQGFLESSNVSVVEELVAMISGQRAYEINSRAVSAADDMLRSAVNIVR